jgi:pimeloyl-ACP methyl ester carboxylesterase
MSSPPRNIPSPAPPFTRDTATLKVRLIEISGILETPGNLHTETSGTAFGETVRSFSTVGPRSSLSLRGSGTRNSITISSRRSGPSMWPFSLRRLSPCSGAARMALLASVALGLFQALAQAEEKEHSMSNPTFYRTILIDGLSIFYREAGPNDAPVLLLLHGLPSSSRMFEPLFSRLSDRFHLVAPDYPGFGHSDWPDPKKFAYAFDHYAEIMNRFTEALGLSRYTLYMQDYGGPVGFRMALAHPERIESLIVQDAVAHNQGLGPNWKTRRAFWADRGANESVLRTNLLSLATTRTRHVGNDPNVERYDPDLWTDEFAFLNQPAQADIQSDLFYDYRTNVEAYPRWQAWMREKQPRLLVIWGKHDLSFELSEPEAYRRDVPNAEVHVLDAGHFALDTAADEIAALVQHFVGG